MISKYIASTLYSNKHDLIVLIESDCLEIPSHSLIGYTVVTRTCTCCWFCKKLAVRTVLDQTDLYKLVVYV